MKLQELMSKTDLDMTVAQVKAFYLGVLCAEKPMAFAKATEELLSNDPESRKALEGELKLVWDELSQNTKKGLLEMFPVEEDLRSFMEISKDQLDYFLTAMSLSGTNTESCQDEELAELIDELEDTVADMDDFLSEDDASEEDGEDFKGFLLGTWKEFVATKQ